jgi:hypothetical protein
MEVRENNADESPMPKKAVLRMGYPARAKLLLSLPLVASAVAVLHTLAGGGLDSSGWGLPILLGAVIASLPAVYTLRTGCEIDGSGITRQSLLGKRRFRRDEFLGHERIAAEPGDAPDLLLRFKQGVIFLRAGHVDRTAQEVIDFLRAEWQVSAADYQPPSLGAVDPVQVFEYETLHISVLSTIGVVTMLIALQVHVFGLIALVGAFCIRAAWRALGSLETDANGLTYTHRFHKPVKLAWSEIESVAYWSSFAQGGVRLRDRSGRKVRVYRWIAGYPMLDRLMHDRLDRKVFWPSLQLPLLVDLNRRRRLGVVAPYILLMANVLELLWQGNLTTFAFVSAVPTFVAAALIWGSSRSLEFGKDGVRDIWRYMWFTKVNTYPRSELQEVRLGRQLTVGGLWMRFGDTRLEITNADASVPPEQILMCLREQWALGREERIAFETGRLRGAA